MPTPHLSAQRGEFADTVLLPGDPLRARHIAEVFFDDAVLVNDVRGALGYTGWFAGRQVSVLGTGMGIPSASIYATELVTEYGVQRLIRVGSCGAVRRDLALRDVVVAVGACTDSSTNRVRYGGMDFAATADFELLRAAVVAAEARDLAVHVGNVHSADQFYDPRGELLATMDSMGVLAVEMEAAGIYGVAAAHGARALAVLTVSDHLHTGARASAEERERSFDAMVEIALGAAHEDGHVG